MSPCLHMYFSARYDVINRDVFASKSAQECCSRKIALKKRKTEKIERANELMNVVDGFYFMSDVSWRPVPYEVMPFCDANLLVPI